MVMEKREKQEKRGLSFYGYDDTGVHQVSQQIMDSYNSGVIGQDQMKSIIEQDGDQQ
jgi:hypothetical protein